MAKVSGDDHQDRFIMDSEASQHIWRDVSKFYSLEENDRVTVHQANDRTVSTGISIIQFLYSRRRLEMIT